MEGDPHPGAFKGRMSFKSFNPSIDKLNEEQAKLRQQAASTSTSSFESGKVPLRWSQNSHYDGKLLTNNGYLSNFLLVMAILGLTPQFNGHEGSSDTDKPKSDSNGDHKRRHHQVVSESQYPNKSPKSNHGEQQSSSSKSKGSFKKPKAENLDWNILRRSKN